MDALTWIVGGSGGAVLSGTALLWHGVRGRVVDDHPVCRTCGYDLFGAPAGGGGVCSECGADLARRRAIRTGNRQRRVVSLAVGVLIGLLGLGMIGTVGLVAARGAGLNHYKPTWWLVRDLRDPAPAVIDAAYAEFDARSRDGRMTADNAATLAAGLTELQADPVRRWDMRGGILLMRLRAGQALGDEPWDTFCRAAIPWRIEVAPHVRRSEPITLSVRAVRPPAENPRGTGWGLRATLMSAEVAGRPITLPLTSVGCINCTAGRPAGGVTADRALPINAADWARVPDGDVPVRCVVEFRIGDLVTGGSGASRWWTGRVTIDAVTRVTDAAAAAATPAASPPAAAAPPGRVLDRQQVARSLTVTADAVDGRLVLDGKDCPVALAAAAYLRYEKSEWRLGEVTARAGAPAWRQSFDAWALLYPGRTMELVLRPDRDLAARAGLSEVASADDLVIPVVVPRQPRTP